MRVTSRGGPKATPQPPYSVLLRLGFTKETDHSAPGELLPHRFTLATALANHGGLLFCGTFPRSPEAAVNSQPTL